MRHVVAMGGGGFLGEGSVTPLDEFALSLAGPSAPSVCFVPTALGDADAAIAGFHRAFADVAGQTSDLGLFWRDARPIEEALDGVDVVYVAGGNTANLLVIWRLHGFDRVLADRAAAGDLVVCGPSAGGLCWFECGVTDSFTPDLGPLHDGMGWLAGSFCPHWDEEPRRKPVYRELVRTGGLPPGLAADGGAAAHFADGVLQRVVTERPGATVHAVTVRDGELVETAMNAADL